MHDTRPSKNRYRFRKYDNLNRITKETTTLSNNSAYSVLSKYDRAGNRTNLTYPNGSKFSYQYDAMNRLTQINRGFKLTLADSAIGSIMNPSPSGRGLPPQASLAEGGGEGGQRDTRYASPDTSVQSLSGRQLFKFTYDPLSRRTNLERVPTDLHTIYTYDTLNRLTSITSSLSESLGDILYPLYDKLGNRKEENNQLVPDRSFHFIYTYNERYELTDVNDQIPNPKFQYQYDLTGNREQSTENGNLTTYVPNSLNQYSSVNGQSYSYDAKGNLINDGACTYSYDYENRLISAACGVQPAATYQYDPFGRRIIKSVDSGLSTVNSLFIHDQNHILETSNCALNLQTCTLTHSYLYSNQIDESLLLTRYEIPGIGKDYYYHQDALGNVITLTDTQNEVVEYVQYDPYGNPRFFNQGGESIPNSSIGNPKLFTGKALDPETGLYHFEARTYSPRIGRFLQRDPYTWGPDDPRILLDSSSRFQKRLIENVGNNLPSLHLPYLYTLNNPINLTDPSGRNASIVFWTVVVLVGIYKGYIEPAIKLAKISAKFTEAGRIRNEVYGHLMCGQYSDEDELLLDQSNSLIHEGIKGTVDFSTSAPGTSLTGPPPSNQIDFLVETIRFIIQKLRGN